MSKKNRKRTLSIVLLIELILVGYILLRDFKILNSINLSKTVEFFTIIILFILSFIIVKIIRKKFTKNKYSYNIITLLGFLIFVILHQIIMCLEVALLLINVE